MKPLWILSLVLILATACAPSRPVVQRADVQYVNTRDGVLTVSAVGYGTSSQALQENAERNALETLLFKGVPGSQQNLPLISDGKQATNRTQPNYLRSFFDGKEYRRFITRSDADSKVETRQTGTRNDQKRSQVWLIDINVNALRRDLEANQMIRKFGY